MRRASVDAAALGEVGCRIVIAPSSITRSNSKRV